MNATLTSRSRAPSFYPTLLERIVARLPMSYWSGSLLLAIVFGPPGFLVYRYLDTSSFSDGLTVFFHGFLPAGLWQKITGMGLWTLFLYASLLMPRYIRVKLQEAEGKIAALLPLGRAQYRRAFRLVFYPAPPILLALLIAVGFANFITASLRDASGPFEWLYHLINLPLSYLAIGTAIWSYFGALWGVYRLGHQPLNLKSGYEDSSLGVRPIGSLSLSISYAYFGLLGLIVIITALNPFIFQLAFLLAVLTSLGAVMFYLPLLGVQRQMLKSKRELQTAIRQTWALWLAKAHVAEAPRGSTMEDLSHILSTMQNMLALQVAERKVNAISTWPFDTTILGRLAAITLSIFIAIITSLIVKFLNQL
jgi:hypothetical protein